MYLIDNLNVTSYLWHLSMQNTVTLY
jgi:hypothetical protein